MASNMIQISKKLMTALNVVKGHSLMFSYKQFPARDGTIKTLFIINHGVWDEKKAKMVTEEVFSSTSMVRIVLFLRDLWFLANGWELPTDQPQWNAVRADLMEKGQLHG